CLVDLVHGNDLDVRRDAMLAAKIEHFLNFADASDLRSGKAAPAGSQREAANWDVLLRKSDDHHCAVKLKKIEILIPVELGRDGVDDQVEGSGEFGKCFRIAGRVVMTRTELLAVCLLAQSLA